MTNKETYKAQARNSNGIRHKAQGIRQKGQGISQKGKGIRQKARRFLTYALCLLFALCLVPFNVKASDPVTVIVSLSPPYTPFLHEYGSGGADKLQVSLIVNDSRMVNYPAKLQMFVEHIGSGIVMRTSEYAPIAPILLTGNVAEVLNGFDLGKYFLAQNNVFAGFDQSQYLQTGRIPDGQYRIGFRLVDAQRTDVVLSNTAYTQAVWFLLNDPPLINLPQNKEKIRVDDLQNVKLEWYPRHFGSLNAAFATSYQIELFAIRVPGMNPNQAAMSMLPDFTDVTNRTSYNLTSDRYPLEPGVEYAFRVKAMAGDGQLTLFQNNGYSEVSSFIYGGLCPEPVNISAQTLGTDKVEITWDTDPLQTSFETRFRTAGQLHDVWHTRKSFVGTAEIANVLSPGTEYEYQVKAVCSTVESDYSALNYFRLPFPAPQFRCGADDSATISNTAPKISLQAGEMIFYGKFPIKLTEVSGSNGVFSGKGRMRVPFLASIQVNMQFTGIKVNEHNEVTEGELVSIYNPNSKFLIDDVTDYFAEGDQIGNIIEGVDSAAITLGFPVDNASGLTVIVSGNSVTLSSGGQSVNTNIENAEEGTTVKDSEGKLYAVDKDGNVSLVGKTAPGGKTQTAAAGTSPQTSLDSQIQLRFENAGKWAFDSYDDAYAGSKFAEEYETIDGRATPWKFVPKGKSDKVSARLTKGNIDLSKITFKTPAGTEFFAEEKGGKLELTLIGAKERDGYELFALYEENDSTTRTIGKLNIASYPLLDRQLTIVPMQSGSVSAATIETAINAIYQPYGISWSVSIDDVFDDRTWDADNNGLKGTETEFYSAFTDEMRALNATYTTQRGLDDKSVYLFWFAEKAEGAENMLGDMPLDSRFGYIFSPAITDKTHQTIAHELGHGMFQLRHTFSPKYKIKKNTTNNLMDYAGGTELTKYQWDVLFDAQNLIATWAQKEGEGAAFGTGTKALCIKDDDALQKLSKYNVFYLPDSRIVDLEGKYKVSGFFTQEDAIESARGAIFSLKINGYDNKHAYSGTKSVGFGYKKNDETLALLAKVDDMSILETSDNVVRIFIDKTNKSIQVKSKAGEILETISFNGECNCVYPEEGFETYFTSNNISQSYIDYFNKRSKKIDNSLHEDTEVIDQLVEKVNADKDRNNKDELVLGTKLADKLKTFEILNNRKFIVATLPINTLCTNQNTWNTIAKDVFEKAGLPADAILITIPYVHCSGIGSDLGEYYFMPGIAFGCNTKIALSKLRTDYSNTQRVAEFARNLKFPVGEFIEDVFTNTYKKAVVYRGIYNGSNAIEAVKYEKDNVTGLPFNKTIELYRQQEYTKLANVVKDWEVANKGLSDVYKAGKLSAYDYANQLCFTDFEYRKKFAEVLTEVSQAVGLEKFTPNSDNLFIYKEEFIESTYGSNKEINAIHYIKNRAFKELQVELNYPYSDDFEYTSNITLNRDFWTDHVDPVVYTTLDVTSITLGIIMPGADIFPESVGLFYSVARLNVERTVAYSIAVAIPTSVGNPIVVNKTFKQLGSNVFKILRRETIEITENATDDLLLDFVEAEYKKGKFSETDYLSIKAKKGNELKTSIDDVLKGVGLANYTNVRKYLTNSRTKQYLTNEQLLVFENKIKTAHPDVLKYLDEMDEYDFAEMARGYRDLLNNDKLSTFENAIKSGANFYGQYGWLTYWKVTPGLKYSLATIDDLREAGKLLPTGNATDIQLASLQAFTRSGDFVNVPMRYNKSYLGEYAEKGYNHILECLDELRKVNGRVLKGEVYSGKTFSKADFERNFVGGAGKIHNYPSFVSTSKQESVAEGFVDLTKKWAGDGDKVAVIQRITSKEGVYIDDLSDWGEHLGRVRHASEPTAIQRQWEVLLNPGDLKQVGEPIPIFENGVHKTIHGLKAYYVDFVQVIN